MSAFNNLAGPAAEDGRFLAGAKMDFPIEFWSSVEGAAFQKGLVRELRAAGCAAAEKFTVPQYDYWAARTRAQRFGLRARTYGLYPLRVWRHFRRATPDGVGVVCSNTFFAPWLAIKAAGPKRQIIHWVFDLYPEVLLAGGWKGAGGAGERWMRGMMQRTFAGAAATVFLGENLLRFAESRYGAIPRARVIEIGADGAPFRGAEPTRLVDPHHGERLELLYCGNLGRMHEVDTLVNALPELRHEPLHVQFSGNGSGFEQLRRRLGEQPHVSFGPNLEARAWERAMREAGVALVTLRESAAGLVMPSKTYSALVAGQAVLAVCPRSSDLAQLVLKHDAGWVVAPGDTGGLVSLVKSIGRDPQAVLHKRRNAWHAGHSHYEQRVVARQWLDLIGEITTPPGPGISAAASSPLKSASRVLHHEAAV